MSPGTAALRIVVVAPAFYEVPPARYGGIERVCYTLVESLVDGGHDVTLVAVGAPHTRAHHVASLAVAPTELVADPVAVEVRHALVAARTVDDRQPDVVHDHTRVGLLSAAGRTCPTVATVHAALAGPESHASLYRAAGSTVALVAVSDAQRSDAPDLGWVGRVYNGISVRDHPMVRERAEYILYLGRLSATKGVELAIMAARATGHRLVLAGDATSPSERDYVEQVVRPLLGKGVEWVGEVDDAAKRELFSGAGCLIFPTQWREPFGLVVVEAMASGVPVVAMRSGAMPELLDDGVTGVLCDTTQQLSAAIDSAMAMDRNACHEWAVSRFNAERMVAGYEAIYRQATSAAG